MKKLLLIFIMLLSVVAAIGQREQYSITVIALPAEGGTVTGGGDYNLGDSCTLTATAKENYKFINWTKQGIGIIEPVSDSTHFAFTVTESATYYANFDSIQTPTYNVTIGEINHAQIEAQPNNNVKAGQYVQVYINNIEPYYELEAGSLKYFTTTGDSTIIDPIDIGYHFEMPASDVTITANFAKRKHQAVIDPGIVNGTITISPHGAIEVGETIRVTASPNEGYKLDSIFYYDPENRVHRIDENSLLMPDYDLSIRASFSIKYHRISVEVYPAGTGTASVEPTFAEQDDTVTIAIAPAQNYRLESIEAYYYNWLSPNTIPTTQLNESTFSFIMVDHDVTVKVNFKRVETPIVGEIDTPEPICAGHALDLVAPPVENAEQEGWQMSDDNFTDHIMAYDGQPLTLSYSGWTLRYWASNSFGMAYSNTVTITVQGFEGAAIEGDTQVILHEQGSYKITGAPNHSSYVWTISDESAIVEEISLNERIITWTNSGTQFVTVVVTENSSRCTDTLSLEVEVGTCIDEDDINTIKAKKHEGKEYILIYPNPKDNYYYQWYRDDNIMEGETDQYLYRQGGLKSGKYKVRLSLLENGTCWVETTEYEIGRGNMVYPNLLHSGSNIVVVKDHEGEALFELYAMDGRLVFNQKLTDQTTTISLNLPQGIYVASIIDQTGSTKAEKIVVQ